MPVCAKGHQSEATDYCDVCGWPMAQAAAPSAQCPECSAPLVGRFCEDCGFDTVLPRPVPRPEPVSPPKPVPDEPNPITGITIGPPPPGERWVATITADRAHFARMRAQQGPDLDLVEFPDFYPERRIMLNGTDILIGKRSESQGLYPHIDLSIAPADIAVSRSHAILHTTGRTLTITDLGSTNGTCVNGGSRPIPANTPVPLRNGDRIHVGGWTTITVTLEPI
ncbi:FHA domain-containing protein [Nocardia huaxiensis]|uniref:FHA domain-containing protein n=1 Tax=Nocardia huaxiensis TaxID=2755382 RepID=A0A7D6Z5Y3_9NOCA|nr:FHA domain-containing protein [Nocardia huaxiensis]QLY27548.1 FHA domain-containing protein [Nocardia huaxiensis]